MLNKSKFKKGNIEVFFITILFMILIISISVIYILYIQINTYIYPIKQDVFYIVQNSYMSLNKEKLSYYEYDVDVEELNQRIKNLIELNYDNVEIEKINYNVDLNKIEITISVNIKPILLTNQIGNINLKINDTIKLKMMEVK